MYRRVGHSIAAAAFAVALLAGTATAGPQDAWITTKAKLALLTTEGVSGTAINVDTVDNQITLHGKVSSAAEKEKAQQVVAAINGVKNVRNLLQVVPASAEKQVQATDDQIKDRVAKAIKNDKSLSDSSIDVKSVNAGVVLLGGTATSLTDTLHAVELAARTPGVHRVASEIQGPDQLAASEYTIDTKKHTSKGTVSGTATDMYITSAAKLRLMADGDTPAMDINVDTQDGVVTLFGIVPTAHAKAAAETDTKKVSGVKSVRNELEVVPAKDEKIVKVQDNQIEETVESSLNGHDQLKGVKVEVKNGVARLSGKVPNYSDRLEAAMIARSTAGVRSVHEELTVTD